MTWKKFWWTCGLVLGILSLGVTPDRLNGQSEPPKGFTSLFNGVDLSGWWSPVGKLEEGGFRVRDGVIEVDGSNRRVPALYTEKTYENFILELDFKISRRGNSGVFLHAPVSGRQSRVGFELQILDDFGREPDAHTTGAVYDVVPPLKNASKPAGEWNHYRVELNWPTLRVWLNGEKVQDLNLASHPVLCFRFRDGYIALQNHGSDAAFRNIYIKELPDKVRWEPLFGNGDLSGWQQVGDARWSLVDGVLRGEGGKGFLVSDRAFDAFELQGYVRRTDLPAGAIRYRWESPEDPGYLAEIQSRERERDSLLQFGRRAPWWVTPSLRGQWMPFQLICIGQFAELRLDGVIVYRVLDHQKVGPGKIAFQCLGGDEPLELRDVRIRTIDVREYVQSK